MTILSRDSDRVNPGPVENPYTESDFPKNFPIPRQITMRAELTHPAVTPAGDFPPIPSDLQPLPCPDGYAHTPMRALTDRLNITATRIMLYIGGKFLDGHPCVYFPKGKVGEELGKEIGKAVRTTEDEVTRMVRKGYLAQRDQWFRGNLYTFLYALYALRDELPEFGAAPDRTDPRCPEPHRPAFDLIGRSADFQQADPEAEPARPAIAAQPGDSSRKSAETQHRSAETQHAGITSTPPMLETCATEPGQAVPQPKTCARIEAVETPMLETCASQPTLAEGHQVATREGDAPKPGVSRVEDTPPVDRAESAYVYGLNSPPPENSYTYAKSTHALAEERLFAANSDAELYGMLGHTPVYKSSLAYSGPLRELTARGLPWPARYEGKTLWVEPPARPERVVKRFAPPPSVIEQAKAEATTLEAKVRQLATQAEPDEAEVKALAKEFMERLGENPKSRISWNFHVRNLREIATRSMPPEVLVDALEKFRSGGAESPRKVFTKHVDRWRKSKGLTTRAEHRAEQRRRRLDQPPAIRAELRP